LDQIATKFFGEDSIDLVLGILALVAGSLLRNLAREFCAGGLYRFNAGRFKRFIVDLKSGFATLDASCLPVATEVYF
jgi:hypothetical protein